MKDILLGLIRLYQCTLSRALPPTCRFFPSCSQYSYEAISRYGLWQGGRLAVMRVSRCHPLNPGGYDPVPSPPTTDDDGPSSAAHACPLIRRRLGDPKSGG